MRLKDLKPVWLSINGTRIGVGFLCPHCKNVYLTVKTVGVDHQEWINYLEDFRRRVGVDYIVPARHDYSWAFNQFDNFDILSIAPSLDASAAGHWHGTIVEGNVN